MEQHIAPALVQFECEASPHAKFGLEHLAARDRPLRVDEREPVCKPRALGLDELVPAAPVAAAKYTQAARGRGARGDAREREARREGESAVRLGDEAYEAEAEVNARERDRADLDAGGVRAEQRLALDRADLEREARRQGRPAFAELRVQVVLQLVRRRRAATPSSSRDPRRIATITCRCLPRTCSKSARVTQRTTLRAREKASKPVRTIAGSSSARKIRGCDIATASGGTRSSAACRARPRARSAGRSVPSSAVSPTASPSRACDGRLGVVHVR